MSPSLPPLPDLVVEHDFDAYQFDGQDWTTTITITLTGGQGDYVVVLDGLGERHENPSSFPLSGTGCVPYTVTGTATAEGAEATQITIPAVPDPCPTEPPVFVTACVTFDDIPVGTIYGEPVGNKPGDQVYTSDDGIAVFVRDFLYSTEGGTFNSAEILAPNADGGGTPSVWFNNINLEFDFSGLPYEPRQVDFEFNDYGGNQNLSVNGSDIYRELLMEAPSPIGGVSWTWADPEGDGIAIGTLDGAVQRFLVGGQELALDTVCAHPG